MAVKKIENVKMGYTWTSYIASVEGALRSAGLWDAETWRLMGQTGMGFHFIVHKQVCPSAVTVYDWAQDHLNAMDRIGIHSQVYSAIDFRMNTSKKIGRRHLTIQESIHQGSRSRMGTDTLLEFV